MFLKISIHILCLVNGAKRLLFSVKLYNTLLEHSLCYLHEASDVSTLHIVDSAICLATELHTLLKTKNKTLFRLGISSDSMWYIY